MRAAWIGAIGFVALVGCAEDPPCGVDADGNDVPFCPIPFEGIAEPINYCPLEHWAADDDCNTCGCSETGSVICTTLLCGSTGLTPTTPEGT